MTVYTGNGIALLGYSRSYLNVIDAAFCCGDEISY